MFFKSDPDYPEPDRDRNGTSQDQDSSIIFFAKAEFIEGGAWCCCPSSLDGAKPGLISSEGKMVMVSCVMLERSTTVVVVSRVDPANKLKFTRK